MIEHAEILAALNARKVWEDRQATWYQMRHDGLRRRNKPFPNAADLHYPLADTLIEKQKPDAVAQVTGMETVATFTGLTQQAAGYASAAAQWFDYQLKQQSNFEDEVEIAADRMMQGGKVPVKVYWDAERGRLVWEAINPVFLIVPPWTKKLRDADWIVHVQHYSKHAFKRLAKAGFAVSDERLKALCEGGTSPTQVETEKYRREGITHSAGKDQLVVWELFFRDEATGGWRVRTYSPSAPKEDLRAEFGLPYNQGVFADPEPPPPFFELNSELKDSGYYDSRGITERVAPFEAKLCKDWNTHADASTLANTPMFYAPNGLPSGTNLRFVPGQILPYALQAVQMPPAPADIPQSMLGTRQVAQELVGVLDWNTPAAQDAKKSKTATEASLIGNQQSQGASMKGRRFRREFSHGLNLAWGILLQYRHEALDFFYLGELMQLPQQALGQKYQIELNGSGENSKAQLMQKAIARFQMFRGDPFIEQGELRKSVIEADDPRLVKRLFVNAGTQAAAQMEDQAQEISIMLIGFPAEVRPTDDDAAHLRSLLGFLERRTATGEPLGPEVLAIMAQHAQAHAAACQQKTPEIWKQLAPQVAMPLRQLVQAGQAAQQVLAQQQQAKAQAAAAAAAVGGTPR